MKSTIHRFKTVVDSELNRVWLAVGGADRCVAGHILLARNLKHRGKSLSKLCKAYIPVFIFSEARVSLWNHKSTNNSNSIC